MTTTTTAFLRSQDLHAVAMPRHKAVGMWLPDKTHLEMIRQHRHSAYAPKRSKTDLPDLASPSSNVADKHPWILVPNAGPGAAKMNAETLRGVVDLEKCIGPGAVVAIKALGPLVQFIGNPVCTFISALQLDVQDHTFCDCQLDWLADWLRCIFWSIQVYS